MGLKELILQLVQIALFFAFPAIWNWLLNLMPWWPLGPDNTWNLIVAIAITVVSWLLGVAGITRFMTQLKTRGLAAEVTAKK
jgi:hypothetical protein